MLDSESVGLSYVFGHNRRGNSRVHLSTSHSSVQTRFGPMRDHALTRTRHRYLQQARSLPMCQAGETAVIENSGDIQQGLGATRKAVCVGCRYRFAVNAEACLLQRNQTNRGSIHRGISASLMAHKIWTAEFPLKSDCAAEPGSEGLTIPNPTSLGLKRE